MEEQNININPETGEVVDSDSKMTLNYVLEQIEKVTGQLEGIRDSVCNIGCVTDWTGHDEDGNEREIDPELSAAKIAAIRGVFEKREETLQQLLAFYQRMYEDLKPERQEMTELIRAVGQRVSL